MKSWLVITPELHSHLSLLAFIDTEYVSDLIMALIETLQGEKLDPEDMPAPVRNTYIYWISENRLDKLRNNCLFEE